MRRGEGSAPADRGRAIVTARQDPPNRNGGRHCCRPPLSPRGGSSGLERRDVRAGRFRTSADERNRGFRHPRRSGSIPGLRPFRLPTGSPSGPGPWRFAADEQSVRRLNLSLPLCLRRSDGAAFREILGRSLGFVRRTKDRNPASAVDASGPKSSPRPAVRPGPGSLSSCPISLLAEAVRDIVGAYEACRPHPLWQGRRVRIAAASSAAPPPRHRFVAWWAGSLFRSGRGWEGFRPFPVDRLCHDTKAVMKNESHQAHNACG